MIICNLYILETKHFKHDRNRYPFDVGINCKKKQVRYCIVYMIDFIQLELENVYMLCVKVNNKYTEINIEMTI